MKPRRFLAVAVATAFALSGAALAADQEREQKDRSAAGGSSQSKQKGASSAGSSAPNAPIIVLVPLAVATTSTFADGCWVKLHDATDFKGNQLSLVGPVDMPNMRTAFGTDWSGQFDSVQVGPKATVTVYDNENYAQKAATFKPGAKVADLDEKMGTFEQIRSVKVACAGGGKTAQQEPDKASASSGASSPARTGERR
jgi:hypothetical protein